MDIFSLFSLLGFLNGINKSSGPEKPSRLKQNIDELSSDLDYFTDMFKIYINKRR